MLEEFLIWSLLEPKEDKLQEYLMMSRFLHRHYIKRRRGVQEIGFLMEIMLDGLIL